MSNIREMLREEMTREGVISFMRFMELALYCPNFGYYEQVNGSPGRRGDFYTSVSVGPLFGELLAAQFSAWNEGSAECGVRNAELRPADSAHREPVSENPERVLEIGPGLARFPEGLPGVEAHDQQNIIERSEASLRAFQSKDANCETPLPLSPDGGKEEQNHNAWQILEAGAHDGRLAMDILGWMKKEKPDQFQSLEYWILEPSAVREASQRKTLGEFAGVVRWFKSWSDLPGEGVNGVIFSNELLDAMPVHRIGWDASNKKWFEWGVTARGDDFVWARAELKIKNLKFQIETGSEVTQLEAGLSSQDAGDAHPTTPNGGSWPQDSALRTPHSALEAVLPDGFTTEICPAAVEWWRQAARVLKTGKIVTFDYGLTAEQFFTPERRDGTLRAYHLHHQSNDLLAHPGEQDLTAQVNFTEIIAAGEAEGLKTETFTSQGQFLVGIVEKNCCDKPAVPEWTSSRIRQFQTLTHPEHLGRAFRVLVQSR